MRLGLARFRRCRHAFRSGCLSFHVISLVRLQAGQRPGALDDVEDALRL